MESKAALSATSAEQLFERHEPVHDGAADATLAAMGRHVVEAGKLPLAPPVAHAGRRAVLDALIGVLAGLPTSEGRAILDFASGQQGSTLVPGTRRGVATSAAAFAGAALCQVHDGNDGNGRAAQDGSAFHPGRVVVATALAAAQARGLTGAQFLTAIAVGYDIATCTRHSPAGVPPDAFGAAAVAAHAGETAAKDIPFVLRLGGFNAPTSDASDFETNNLTIAHQARAGIEAAQLVESGYPASGTRSFRSRDSQGREFSFAPPGRLGDSLLGLYFKPYPSCRKTHGFIEAALKLRPKLAASGEVGEVRVFISARDRGPAHKVGPGAYFKSYQFSIGYCTAAALAEGAVTPVQFRPERTDSALVQGLQERLVFIVDEDLAGTLEIEFADGTRHAQRVQPVPGSPEVPLSDEAIAQKLVHWLQMEPHHAQMLLASVMALDNAPDISALLEVMAGLGDELVRRG